MIQSHASQMRWWCTSGHLQIHRALFGVFTVTRGYYWHLGSRGQGAKCPECMGHTVRHCSTLNAKSTPMRNSVPGGLSHDLPLTEGLPAPGPLHTLVISLLCPAGSSLPSKSGRGTSPKPPHRAKCSWTFIDSSALYTGHSLSSASVILVPLHFNTSFS